MGREARENSLKGANKEEERFFPTILLLTQNSQVKKALQTLPFPILEAKDREAAKTLLERKPASILIFKAGEEDFQTPYLITIEIRESEEDPRGTADFSISQSESTLLPSLIAGCAPLLSLKKEKRLSDRRHKEELYICEKVRSLFLNDPLPATLPNLSITTASFFSSPDGDFVDFYPHSQAVVDLAMGDVMGKGLAAALLSTAIKLELKRFALRENKRLSYTKETGWELDLLSPTAVLENVHRELIDPLKELEVFAALFFGRFDFQKRQFTYVDCGFTKPILISKQRKALSLIQSESLPIGISLQPHFLAKTIPFDEEDLFIFYSDGVVKTRSASGELFGTHRLTKAVESEISGTPEEIIASVRRSLTAFAEEGSVEDEASLLILQVSPSLSELEAPFPNRCSFSADLSQLPLLREFVENFCRKIPGISKRFTNLIEIAVNEVANNIILHGTKEERGKTLTIDLGVAEGNLVVELFDDGVSFNPSEIEEPDFTGCTARGFGLYILKSIADTIHYTPKSSGSKYNILKFTKSLLFNEVNMNLIDKTKDGVLVITLEGDFLDAKEAPEFKKGVAALYNKHGNHRVVLDFANLTFIDSTGLGALLSLLRTLNGLHGDLKLANLTRPIRTIFELVCMHKIFPIFSSVDDAVASFSKQSVNNAK